MTLEQLSAALQQFREVADAESICAFVYANRQAIQIMARDGRYVRVPVETTWEDAISKVQAELAGPIPAIVEYDSWFVSVPVAA